MNRHLNILDYTLRSIIRRLPWHLSVVVIFLTVIFISATVIISLQSLKREADLVLSLSPEIIVQNMVGGRQVPIEEAKAGKIGSILGIESVRPRVWGYFYEPYSGANFTLWGINGHTIRQMTAIDLTFREGGIFKPEERGKIVVGDKVPGVLNLNGRKNITLTDSLGIPRNFEIAGVFTAASSLLTADLMLMHEEDLRSFFHLAQDMATDIVVAVANPAEIAMVAQKISEMFPSCRTVSRSQIRRTYEAVFSFRGGMALYVWMGCLVAFLILLWNKGRIEWAAGRKEMGILKALGWSASDILEMKIMEAMIIGIFSFIAGYLAAYLHVAVFDAALLRPVLFGWSVLYPTFELWPVVSLKELSLAFVLTVFPYMAVSQVSVWRSTTVDAGELLRGDL